jgi:NADP-dependent 3-hydroxy acid dehydrogenase YdfG
VAGVSGAAEPRVAVVTGASSGIGAATARALARRGFRVALGARREERLAAEARAIEAEGGKAFAHRLDVGDAVSVDAFFGAVETQLGAPGVVVSNAGVGTPYLLHEAPVEVLEAELRTNLLGALLVARRAIPGLRERGRGDLVFVSSLNAVLPRTFQAAYTASKAGLEAAARVLQMELEGSGVRVTIVRPGPTGSEFGSHWGGDAARRVLASWQYWGVMRQLHWMPAERVADVVAGVVEAPPDTALGLVEVLPENPRPGPL